MHDKHMIDEHYQKAEKVTDILALNFKAPNYDLGEKIIGDSSWGRFVKTAGDLNLIINKFSGYREQLIEKFLNDIALQKQCISSVSDLIILTELLKKPKEFAQSIQNNHMLDKLHITQTDSGLLKEKFPELNLTDVKIFPINTPHL